MGVLFCLNCSLCRTKNCQNNIIYMGYLSPILVADLGQKVVFGGIFAMYTYKQHFVCIDAHCGFYKLPKITQFATKFKNLGPLYQSPLTNQGKNFAPQRKKQCTLHFEFHLDVCMFLPLNNYHKKSAIVASLRDSCAHPFAN